MNARESLLGYVPTEQTGVKIQTYLAPVAARLSRYLPKQLIWALFHSLPEQTGGVVIFPYCRVDREIVNARDCMKLAALETEPTEVDPWYKEACQDVFKAVTWIEVGFEGLQNLASSPASRNWTSAVGHFVDDAQRAERIMTDGKAFYEQGLREFTQFRTDRHITDDYFAQFGLEHLLDPFRG